MGLAQIRRMRRRFSLKECPSHRAGWLVAFLMMAFVSAAFADPVPNTCEIHYPSDAGIAWTCHQIGRHDTPASLFGSNWQNVVRFNRIDRRHVYPGVRLKVPDNLKQVKDFTPLPSSYPPAIGDAKFILVNLTEQFLGSYANGGLLMSFPITSGYNADLARRTPNGLFTVNAYDSVHSSSLYKLAHSGMRYPMHYGLRFFTTPNGVFVWIHGRDVPGYAASHGCIGLYDEKMQKDYYGYPRDPVLEDARTLYKWAIAPHPDDGLFHELQDGPRVQIVGHAPDFLPRSAKHAADPQRVGRRPNAGLTSAPCGG